MCLSGKTQLLTSAFRRCRHILVFLIAFPPIHTHLGFPHGSAGKESTCRAGDTGDEGLIPGSGRSPGGKW